MAALLTKTFATQTQRIITKQLPLFAAGSSEAAIDITQPSRGFPTSKHWDPKWRLQRKKKFMKIELPTFVELKKDRKDDNRTPDEIRKEMKKEGRLPPRNFQELPLNFSCTRSLIDEYKPPDGDGKQSLLSSKSLSEGVSKMMKGPKSIKHVRKLKKYEDFQEAEFAQEAQNIYIEAQTLLQDIYKNQDRLHELVTEKAFPEMVHGLETKTMRWSLTETVEPARVVHIRTEEVLTSDNLFAQVTVRLHTKQILAIYDRFGRLMYGDPTLPKSVVEYVIFEKWISDTYGRWRIHGKLIPDWIGPRDSLLKTYRVPNFEPLPPVESDDRDKSVKKKEDTSGDDVEKESDKDSSSGPRLASAQIENVMFRLIVSGTAFMGLNENVAISFAR